MDDSARMKPFDRRTVLAGFGFTLAAGAPVPSAQPGASIAESRDSAAIQSAYDALVRAGGGTLLLPQGSFPLHLRLTSRLVNIQGAGQGVTILRPVSSDMPILQALYSTGSWDAVSISNLSMVGEGDGQGIGVRHGHDTYLPGDEYAGRTILSKIGFANLGVCVERAYGNIGLTVDQCVFGAANYHFFVRGRGTGDGPYQGDPMHGGNMIVTRSHFSRFAKAMLFVASPEPGAGQIVFENNIMEVADGFVIYVRGFGGIEGVPAIRFARNWNERTADGRNIAVEGVMHGTARYLFARQCRAPIVFDDTPLGSLELIETSVETAGCGLDNMTDVVLDNASTLRHREARQYSGVAPGLCSSIAGPTLPFGLRTPWFRMPLPKARSRAYAQHVRLASDGITPIPFTGTRSGTTASRGGDAALPGGTASQHFSLAGGDRLWVEPGFAVTSGRWLVALYIYRLISGAPVTVRIDGTTGLSGPATLDAPEWEMLVNISQNLSGPVTKVSLWHTLATGKSDIRIGGLAVLDFPDRQSAVAFANSGLFPG